MSEGPINDSAQRSSAPPRSVAFVELPAGAVTLVLWFVRSRQHWDKHTVANCSAAWLPREDFDGGFMHCPKRWERAIHLRVTGAAFVFVPSHTVARHGL